MAERKLVEALQQISQMVAADSASDADIAEMFWKARAIARAALAASKQQETAATSAEKEGV